MWLCAFVFNIPYKIFVALCFRVEENYTLLTKAFITPPFTVFVNIFPDLNITPRRVQIFLRPVIASMQSYCACLKF